MELTGRWIAKALGDWREGGAELVSLGSGVHSGLLRAACRPLYGRILECADGCLNPAKVLNRTGVGPQWGVAVDGWP